MRGLISFIGVVTIVQGVGGLLGQLGLLGVPHRFGIANRLPFLDGYEILGNLAVAVLGLVLVIAAARVEKSGGAT